MKRIIYLLSYFVLFGFYSSSQNRKEIICGYNTLIIDLPERTTESILNYEEGFIYTFTSQENGEIIEVFYGSTINTEYGDSSKYCVTKENYSDDLVQKFGLEKAIGKHWREDKYKHKNIIIAYSNVDIAKLHKYDCILNSIIIIKKEK